ncbi:hypothetical protein [Thermodesulfobacterium thermophilum]|uniref:hypothetical protein n=1 Tax=Thermodesulfobacterium thermophilum TaxID=886 RepID=UPI0012DD1E26|nr:hypothetical protein [Thermodesulfobacterium thermophilum]
MEGGVDDVGEVCERSLFEVMSSGGLKKDVKEGERELRGRRLHLRFLSLRVVDSLSRFILWVFILLLYTTKCIKQKLT